MIPVLLKDATLPSDALLPQGMDGFDDLQCVTMNEDYWDEGCERLRSSISEITGVTKLRKRMSISLMVLTIGVVYELLGTVIEFNSGVPIAVDTHLGSLTLLAAGTLILIARAFLQTPAKRLLKFLYLAFIVALLLGVSSVIIGWKIWQAEYNAILLDSIIATVMIVAGWTVLHGAREMAVRG